MGENKNIYIYLQSARYGQGLNCPTDSYLPMFEGIYHFSSTFEGSLTVVRKVVADVDAMCNTLHEASVPVIAVLGCQDLSAFGHQRHYKQETLQCCQSMQYVEHVFHCVVCKLFGVLLDCPVKFVLHVAYNTS